MRLIRLITLALLLGAATNVASRSQAGQEHDHTHDHGHGGDETAKFPDYLFEGVGDFEFAIQMHGDLRGNYGPCG